MMIVLQKYRSYRFVIWLIVTLLLAVTIVLIHGYKTESYQQVLNNTPEFQNVGFQDPDPLPQDSQGWTQFTPSANTRLIYVSSSDGNDATGEYYSSSQIKDPFHPTENIKPFKTLAAATEQSRHNYPDWILLQKGDTWQESFGSWQKGGVSPQQPFLIASYGSSKKRPILITNGQPGLQIDGSNQNTPNPLSNLAVVGLEFYAQDRDPNDRNFDSTKKFKADRSGIFIVEHTGENRFSNILIEDCKLKFSSVVVQAISTQGTIKNFKIRRSIIIDHWATDTHAQGLYLNKIDGILIEGNVFDHNGWSANFSKAKPTMFNHNIYIQRDNVWGNITVKDNIISRAASHGLQLRPGGLAENNLFVRNAIAIYTARGKSIIGNNVVLGGRNITPELPRGWGIEAHQGNGVLVANNIVANKNSQVGDGFAFQLGFQVGMSSRDGNLFENIQNNNMQMINNISYNWNTRYQGNFKIITDKYKLLVVKNNIFQLLDQNQGTPVVKSKYALPNNNTTFSHNTYYTAVNPEAAFNINDEDYDFEGWKTLSKEHDAKFDRAKFFDPDRNIATYSKAIGGAGTFEDFISHAGQQSKDNWRPEYTANAVNDYIREGFCRDICWQARFRTWLRTMTHKS